MRNPGGAYRDRTDDPLLAKQVLYQLSYAPVAYPPTGSARGHRQGTRRLDHACRRAATTCRRSRAGSRLRQPPADPP